MGAQASVRNGQRAPLLCPGSFLHFPGTMDNWGPPSQCPTAGPHRRHPDPGHLALAGCWEKTGLDYGTLGLCH